MKVSFKNFDFNAKADTLVLPVYEDDVSGPVAAYAGLPDVISAMKKNDKAFKGKHGQILYMTNPLSLERTIFVGVGKSKNLSAKTIAALAEPVLAALKQNGSKTCAVVVDRAPGVKMEAPQLGASLANALREKSYKFDKYLSKKDKNEEGVALESVTILTEQPQDAKAFYKTLSATTDSAFFAADLANEPPNVLNPESYAARIQQELEPLGVKVTVIKEDVLKAWNAGGILAVGQGSATPPCLVVMEYDGLNDPQAQPVGLVGKGITFDTGGYSIKPAAGMGSMKMDMGGSAAVVGAMRALAARKAQTKVVGIVALAENMVSSRAYRPGDIIRTMAGKTVEIDNTDAEGRLVLADALTYMQRHYKPHTIVDLATLTGACVVALGGEFSGVFSNNDKLWAQLEAAGKTTGETGWRMPLHQAFAKAMKGTVADLTNSSNDRGAGASKAAEFLHYFIEKDRKGRDACRWAHIDIAGPAIPKSGISVGYGVKLLNRFIADNFEKPCQKPGKAPKLSV